MYHRRSYTFPFCLRSVPDLRKTPSPKVRTRLRNADALYEGERHVEPPSPTSPAKPLTKESWLHTDQVSSEMMDASFLPSFHSFECRGLVPKTCSGSSFVTEYEEKNEASDWNQGLEDTKTENSSQILSSSGSGYADDEGSESHAHSSSQASLDDENVENPGAISVPPKHLRPRNPVEAVDGGLYSRAIHRLPLRTRTKAMGELLDRLPRDAPNFSEKEHLPLKAKRPLPEEDYEVPMKRAKLSQAEKSTAARF